eukprot:SAG25_NODE_2172_length_1873_cov_1.792559_2_plen_288_part_01
MQVWIEEQTKLYGNPDHIFSADTFTEMPPRSMTTSYLASAGAAISKSMRSADPAAVWLCQSWGMIGWSAVEIGAYLGAVPKENMMILLVAGNWFSAPERDYFAGHPYIWGFLENFGGKQGLGPPMAGLSSRLGQAMHTPLPAKPAPLGNDLTAIGLSMEGIHRNYLTIDYVLQANWGRSPGLKATDACNTFCNPNGCHGDPAACDASLRGWATSYGRRRYGTAGGAAAMALWGEIFDVAYSAHAQSTGAHTALFAARPTLCITPCTSGPGAAGILLAGDKSIARHQAV